MSSGHTRIPWRRIAGAVAATLLLALTFLAYLSPHFALDLATRLWACF